MSVSVPETKKEVLEFFEEIEFILISIYAIMLATELFAFAYRRRLLKKPPLRRPRPRRPLQRRKKAPRQRLRYVVSVFIHFIFLHGIGNRFLHLCGLFDRTRTRLTKNCHNHFLNI